MRGSDGKLMLGKLSPGAPHVLPSPVGDPTVLYQGNGKPIVLRCLRGTVAPGK